MEKIIVTTLSPEQFEAAIFVAVSKALKMQGITVAQAPDKPSKHKTGRSKKKEVPNAEA